jgi:RNA polymerase sigma-70 factor, ECF subfamily
MDIACTSIWLSDGFALLPPSVRGLSELGSHASRGLPLSTTDPDTSQRTDADLLGLSAQGDKNAFGELYDRFARPLFSLAMKITGNASEAEDLVQEVFVELWTKAPEFDAARAQAFTWAVAITRNKAIDRLRMRQRRGAIVERASEDIVSFSLGAEGTDAREALYSDESATIVRAAFRELPEEQRAPLTLAYFEGLSQTEIAERLEQPLGTVKARMRRGLCRLRDVLGGRP